MTLYTNTASADACLTLPSGQMTSAVCPQAICTKENVNKVQHSPLIISNWPQTSNRSQDDQLLVTRVITGHKTNYLLQDKLLVTSNYLWSQDQLLVTRPITGHKTSYWSWDQLLATRISLWSHESIYSHKNTFMARIYFWSQRPVTELVIRTMVPLKERRAAEEASRAEQAKLREAAQKADAARRQEEAAKRTAARQQQVCWANWCCHLLQYYAVVLGCPKNVG